ncbi:transcription antitermination protein NusB [Flindersiella endophytica]
MPARGKARKRAVDILYEAEMRGLPRLEILAERLMTADPPVNEYTVTLVEGIDAQAEELDKLLTEYAIGWTLDRMPPVDRSVLRIGAYELMYAEAVPDAVAISEAVRLARELSTDESPGFVNGLLAKLLEQKTARH